MPTNKKRVGFIPRDEVMIILKKLSKEENLSQSKIVSILVEEALENRQIFNKKRIKDDLSNDEITSMNKSSNSSFINNQIQSNKGIKYSIDNPETYSLFLQFLKFQRMISKNHN